MAKVKKTSKADATPTKPISDRELDKVAGGMRKSAGGSAAGGMN